MNPLVYKPISLLSDIGKIIDMLMNRYIMPWLEWWRILRPSQCGFLSGREVVDACSRLGFHLEM